MNCIAVYVLFLFWFQSFSPIPIAPFQDPPLFCSTESPDSLHLRQVYQPVPRDQATDPADPVFGQSVSQREPGATAEGYRVSTANYHSHSLMYWWAVVNETNSLFNKGLKTRVA